MTRKPESVEGLGSAAIETISLKKSCVLSISSFYSNISVFNPTSGDNLLFNGEISHNVPWTLTIVGRTFTGTGNTVSVAWDGKDQNGKLVPAGNYTATLSVQTSTGNCLGSESITVKIESCNLQITAFKGSNQTISPESGGNIELSGEIFDDSGSNVNWLLAVAGKSYSGSGNAPSITWDGMDASDHVVEPGSYAATLTARTDGGQCIASKTINFTVVPAPEGQCGLLVQFGSSAHVASGALTHSQELFTAKGANLPAGVVLHYNSRDGYVGALGTGWSHSYDVFLKQAGTNSILVHEGNGQRKLYQLVNGIYVSQPGDYSTLAKKANGSFILTRKDGTVNTFSADGKLTTITDRNSNLLSLTYSGGNLATVTDPAGRIITFAYDAANHLISMVDPSGNTFDFNVTGNSLTSVTQPDHGKWQFTYDAKGFMISKTDPLLNNISYIYDERHRVISATDPEGRTRNIVYPQTSDTVRSTIFTEKDEGAWTYSYDTEKGTLNSKADPQGGVTSYTYDAAGNRTSTTNPDGTTTTSTYDGAGNMLTSTDALEQTTGYSYNAFGQVTGITDPQGGTTTYAYDVKGNMTSLSDATGATTTYAYDAKGNTTKVTNAAGQATTFTYDAKGNLASITDPAGASTSYTYDAAGNVISITDTKGAVTQFFYDNRNQLIKTIDPQGNATLYSYDANGNKLSETDANGNTTTFEYNSRNQLIKTRDALGSVTTYAYGGSTCPSCGGGADKLTAITDANGNITSYLYDQLGRSVKEADPLGNSTAYAYDARNNPVSKTDANGDTINFSYDANGRLLKKSYPDGTEETFIYDAKGNLVTATNKHISYTFSYDAAGRVKSVSDSTGKVISYEYDLLGNKTRMISPEGKSLTYIYDKANRLTSIINGGTFTFGYDTKGQRTSLSYPNGDTATYGYDKQGRLTSLVRKNSAGTVISSNSYTLDKIGNRQTSTTQERTSSYNYDNIYRLLQTITNTPGFSNNTKTANGTNNAVQQQKDFFSYDPVGNRLTAANNRSYAYGPGNQLISENGTTYNYDKSGNLTQKSSATETTFYSWDYENRLVKVTTPTTAAEYAYDPFGRRIEKKTTENGESTTTKFFYDNQSILLDYDETGTIGNRYIHGPNIDEPLAVTTGKDKYYYHADGLGSIVAMTDASGKVVQTYEYDSFGNLKDQMNRVKQPFTYTGREWDKETGTYHYRKRTYDPMDGRFISKDPIGFDGGINLYNYALSNPINFTDPYGERVSVFTRSLDMKVKSGPYVHCVLVVEKCDGTKQTWDFQNDNKVYNPAKTPSNPIKNPVTTVVYAKDDLDDKVSFLANQMGNPNYDTTKYNCCYWVEDVLKKAGISWKNPNPWPAN